MNIATRRSPKFALRSSGRRRARGSSGYEARTFRSKITFRRNIVLLRALRASLFSNRSETSRTWMPLHNASLLVDLRDRVRLVDLRDGLGPRRVAHGKAHPVAGVQGIQPCAILDLEFFGRGAGVRAGGAIRHILD